MDQRFAQDEDIPGLGLQLLRQGFVHELAQRCRGGMFIR